MVVDVVRVAVEIIQVRAGVPESTAEDCDRLVLFPVRAGVCDVVYVAGAARLGPGEGRRDAEVEDCLFEGFGGLVAAEVEG